MVDPISIAGMAVSGLASIYGAVQANANRKKAEAMLEQQKADMQEWRDREMNTNYLLRADSQALLKDVREQGEEYLQGMSNDAVRAGMSDEAKVAMAQQANKAYSDAASQLAAAGQQHKDNVENTWMTQKDKYDQLKIQNLLSTGEATQNMISGLGGALTSFGTLSAMTPTSTPTSAIQAFPNAAVSSLVSGTPKDLNKLVGLTAPKTL